MPEALAASVVNIYFLTKGPAVPTGETLPFLVWAIMWHFMFQILSG